MEEAKTHLLDEPGGQPLPHLKRTTILAPGVGFEPTRPARTTGWQEPIFPGLGPRFSEWTALYQAQESRPNPGPSRKNYFPLWGADTGRVVRHRSFENNELEWRWVRASRQPLTGEWQCPRPGDATLESAKSW